MCSHHVQAVKEVLEAKEAILRGWKIRSLDALPVLRAALWTSLLSPTADIGSLLPVAVSYFDDCYIVGGETIQGGA